MPLYASQFWNVRLQIKIRPQRKVTGQAESPAAAGFAAELRSSRSAMEAMIVLLTIARLNYVMSDGSLCGHTCAHARARWNG